MPDRDEREHAIERSSSERSYANTFATLEPEEREPAVAKLANVAGRARRRSRRGDDAPEHAQRDLRGLRRLDLRRPGADRRCVSDAAYRIATAPTPKQHEPEVAASSTSRLTSSAATPTQRTAATRDGRSATPSMQRVRRRLVDEGVKRGEAEEGDGEHERSLLSGPPRHPREDDGLGRPARPREPARRAQARA